MKIKSSDILGKKIISKNESKELAVADDLFFDTKKKKVVAVLIGTKDGLENAKAVLLTKVKSISETIMIESEKDIVSASEVIKPEKDHTGRNQIMMGNIQITESGQDLGEITDITFDSKTGEISNTTSNVDGAKKTAKVDKIISTSAFMTVVKGKEEKPDEGKNPIQQIKSFFQ